MLSFLLLSIFRYQFSVALRFTLDTSPQICYVCFIMRHEEPIARRWKEFDLSPPATRTLEYVSIRSDGGITFNRAVYEAIGSPRSVSLLYDEDHETIGVLPVDHLMPTSFPVAVQSPSLFVIRAKLFLKATKLDIAYCIRFTDPFIEDGTLILDLHHTARAGVKRYI